MAEKRNLFLLVLVLSCVRLAISGSFELALDEGYYWLWSKHLSLSYYDHPPMVALMIAATTVLDDSEIFIRLGAVGSAAVSTILLYNLATKLFDKESAGWHAAWIANLTLIFSVGALVVSPDTPLVPFYLLAMILFFDAVQERGIEMFPWIVAGAVVGLAMLSKYTAVFFIPGALLYLVLSPENRRWLFRPHPYVAALIAALVFSPVVVWNWQHDWISFSFQAKHGLESSQGNPLGHFLEFAGFQMTLYSIGLFLFIIAGGVSAVQRAFSAVTEPRLKNGSLFLVSFAAPTLMFFSLNSMRATVEGNWPILGFVPLIVQAGGMADQWLNGVRTRTLFISSVVLAVVLVTFVHIQIVDPVIPHPKRFEISRRIYGWKLLAAVVDEDRKAFTAGFLIAERFQTASLIDYYTHPHIPSYVIGADNRKRYTYLPPVDVYAGGNAFYLTEESRDNFPLIGKVFEKVVKSRTVEITRKGELIRRFVLYKCYNYLGGLDKLNE